MNQPLADYQSERADFQRVLDAMQAIQLASEASLTSPEWLVELIQGVGLVPIPNAGPTYEGHEQWINGTQQGLIQLPGEYARWLLALGEHRPQSYLEIGCFNGATICLAAAYLRRFVPDARVVSCDVFPGFLFHQEAIRLAPIEYAVGKTSFDFRDQQFDAVFIDGDHTFEWAWADYCNVGRQARLCALHDVNNAPYREMHLGGICGVWELIKAQECGDEAECIEFFEHPSRSVMGIGVRLRRQAGVH